MATPLPFPVAQQPTQAQQPPMTFPAPVSNQPPATTPQPETAGNSNPLGLGNNMETWLAGLQLLGGLMQPVQMGDTTGGVTGRALANAASTFAGAKSAKAEGEREDKKVKQGDRKIDVAEKQIDADLFKDANINDLEQARIDYLNRLPQAGGDNDLKAADQIKKAWLSQPENKNKTPADAEIWFWATSAKNPEQVSPQARNTAVITGGTRAGLQTQDMVPTLTDPSVGEATSYGSEFQPVPNFAEIPEENLNKLAQELTNPETIKYIDQTYGPEFYKAFALRGLQK